MRTKTGNAILKILLQRHGRGAAISSTDICRALGWKTSRDRAVRRIIADENALWPDVLICAVPGDGFFCAATFEEVVAYDHWLAHLAKDANEKIATFRRVAMQLGFNVAALPEMQLAA